HLAGVAGDDGRAEDAVGALLHVHLDETLLLAIGYGAVDGGQGRHEGVDGDALPGRVALVHADVRDLRVGVGAPGDVQRAQLLPARKRVFWITMRAAASAMCVNLCCMQTSPAA